MPKYTLIQRRLVEQSAEVTLDLPEGQTNVMDHYQSLLEDGDGPHLNWIDGSISALSFDVVPVTEPVIETEPEETVSPEPYTGSTDDEATGPSEADLAKS